MAVLIVRAKVKEEHAAAAEAAAKKMFAAIDKVQPDNIRYASLKLADGVTFVALLEVAEGTENPLPAIPEFREFGAGLEEWRPEPPTTDQATIVGSYRLFD